MNQPSRISRAVVAVILAIDDDRHDPMSVAVEVVTLLDADPHDVASPFVDGLRKAIRELDTVEPVRPQQSETWQQAIVDVLNDWNDGDDPSLLDCTTTPIETGESFVHRLFNADDPDHYVAIREFLVGLRDGVSEHWEHIL